jgi:hypothetical protein
MLTPFDMMLVSFFQRFDVLDERIHREVLGILPLEMIIVTPDHTVRAEEINRPHETVVATRSINAMPVDKP